jgi:uncharacterized protein (TIGR02284 family)
MDANVLSPEQIIHELNEVLQVDIDALGAYQAAIDAIDDPEVKRQLGQFQADHQRHVIALKALVQRSGGTPKERADLKGILQRGFTRVAGLVGAESCLKAMLANEKVTNAVYSRHCQKPYPEDVLGVLRRGLDDEQRHYEWLEGALRERPWEQPGGHPPAA